MPPKTTTPTPCVNEPRRPAPSEVCDWIPVRNSVGCILEWDCRECEKETQSSLPIHPSPLPDCEDLAGSFECYRFSYQGWCYTNVHFMADNCKRSCGYCVPKPYRYLALMHKPCPLACAWVAEAVIESARGRRFGRGGVAQIEGVASLNRTIESTTIIAFLFHVHMPDFCLSLSQICVCAMLEPQRFYATLNYPLPSDA